MDKFVIQGGTPLKGKVLAGGSKNCALPVMFATLLAQGKHRIRRVPNLADMESTLKMLLHLGCEVDKSYHGTTGADWVVDTTKANDTEAPYDLVRKMRASNLCLGPILARHGRARVSLPGGCAIGARPMDLHLMALERMGAVVTQSAGYIEAKLSAGQTRLKGAKIVFPLVSVGATENTVMAATLANGTTVIENAAQEPEVRGLCEALISMGAKIQGVGTSVLTIEGVQALNAMNFTIPPDRIEVATYLIGAHMTGGDVTMQGAAATEMGALLQNLELSGADVEQGSDWVRVHSRGHVKPVNVVTAPYPGFATDMQAQWTALMSVAEGAAAVTETIFENRFMHVPELVRMGAKIDIDGSTVRIHGKPGCLEGAPVMATDLRASACLVLAAVAARGESHIKRIYHLDRGYESMEVKLRALGAKVEREAE